MVTKKLHTRKSVRAQSKEETEQALRLSKEVNGFMQPLMDWYQFKSLDHLIPYLEEICDIREIKAQVTHAKIRHLMSGERQLYDDVLKWVYSTMRRMKQAVIEGRREFIGYKQIKKYILPNDEPLHDLIVRALREFTGKEDQKATESIEHILEDTNKVRLPSGLVQRIEKEYGFVNPQKTHEFLADVAGIPLSYRLLNLTGEHKTPSNYHRKMFAVTSVLDYAFRNGFKKQTIDSILERGRKRSAKEGTHAVYLAVPRKMYGDLLKKMEVQGVKDHILCFILSQVSGISLDNAREYISRRTNVMDFYYYKRLEEFSKDALPNIYVIDLSDEKKRQAAYKGFLKLYRGEHLLLVYSGPESIEVNKMAESIHENARKKLGLTFKFDQHNTILVPGFEKEDKLLANSKYG